MTDQLIFAEFRIGWSLCPDASNRKTIQEMGRIEHSNGRRATYYVDERTNTEFVKHENGLRRTLWYRRVIRAVG